PASTTRSPDGWPVPRPRQAAGRGLSGHGRPEPAPIPAAPTAAAISRHGRRTIHPGPRGVRGAPLGLVDLRRVHPLAEGASRRHHADPGARRLLESGTGEPRVRHRRLRLPRASRALDHVGAARALDRSALAAPLLAPAGYLPPPRRPPR